jgi:hypothetical protein
MTTCSSCKRSFESETFKNGRPVRCCPACRERGRARNVRRDPVKNAAYQRELRRKYRQEAFDAYGSVCACCGEGRYEFLTIDHPNGGGRKEREAHSVWGPNFVRWLARQGYPPGYRVLCHNCNSAYGYYGYCPHQDHHVNERTAVAVHV